jgi:hypothetical protein
MTDHRLAGDLGQRLFDIIDLLRNTDEPIDARLELVAEALSEIIEFVDRLDGDVGACVTHDNLEDALDRLTVHCELQR